MSRDRVELLKDEFEMANSREGWYAPLAALLEGIGPVEAAWQPPGGGNTIWQTVNHLNYYNERILLRVRGAEVAPGLGTNEATFGPGNPEDAAAWAATVQKAHEIAEGYARVLPELTDADLQQEVFGGPLLSTLSALVLHLAYHTGQVALIRKMQHSWPATR
ncbi:MAG TPA: DinB family protein [Symbiobacteriaceae bacterium]|nr:DinB family protein [Symbiobacteriaceae bacterium]